MEQTAEQSVTANVTCVAPAFTQYLYMSGDANGWSFSNPLYSAAADGKYTGFMYLNQNDWRVLSDTRPTGLNIDNGAYKQYAVTFVENHDVQDRGTTSIAESKVEGTTTFSCGINPRLYSIRITVPILTYRVLTFAAANYR